jgi:hypothetical protein
MAKPSVLTDWANSGSADVVTPPAGKVARGWIVGERPPAGFLNFLFKEIVGWLGYVRDFETFAHTFSALATFNGAAGDDVAAIASAPSTITARKLLWEMGGGSEGRKVRFYRTSAGLLEVTFNARWRASTTDWSADTSVIGARADSAKLVVSSAGLAIYRPATTVGTSTWADSSFEKLTWGPDDGRWSVVSPTTGAGGSNPASSEAVSNQLRAKNIPKAWATILISSGTASAEEGFNIAGASQSAGTLTVKFPTSAGMQNANYSAVVTSLGALTIPKWGVYARRVDGLDIISDADITTGTHRVALVVFGRQG